MSYIKSFLPILLFVIIFAGSGIYFTLIGTENAFYQLSPITAIIPAIALAWLLYKGNTEERIDTFLDGVRHKNIITMCIIFLLAGAFSEVTKNIGSVDATVSLALSLIPAKFLLIGIFLISAFISTAIGTSMGTIATIAPIAAGLSGEGSFSTALSVATVISGAMFGDNLSIISDTTIAAITSQQANLKKKIKLNSKIAIVTSIITIVILYISTHINSHINTCSHEYSLLLITPYIFLILLALTGIHVFIALIVSLVFAWFIGLLTINYTIINFSQNIIQGFTSMQEIMLLSLLIGGLSGLISKGTEQLAQHLAILKSKYNSKIITQLIIAKMACVLDILLANNTIAIIFCGNIAKDLAKEP